jgi:ATPase subunit of ABC transporter with duplicated ATPase domains
VGGNGTGKSTLMKILGGMDTFDYGSLIVAKGTSAGYLPQDGLTLSGRSVFAECMSVFDDLRAMEPNWNPSCTAWQNSTTRARNIPRSPTAIIGSSTSSAPATGIRLKPKWAES